MNDTPLHDAPPPPASQGPPNIPGPPDPPGPPAPPPIILPAEPLNPWFSIWVQPRATMRQILDRDPRRMVHLLALAAGALGGLEAHVPAPASEMMPLPAIVTMKLILGALGALLFLYLFGFLIRLTGGWLHGTGEFVAVRSALAWSMIPNIWAGLLLLPLLVYMGAEALNFDPVEAIQEPGGAVLLVPLTLLTMVIAIWSIVITIKCVAEAHRFSAWNGFGAALLSIFIVSVPIVMIVVFVAVVAVGMLGLSLP